MGDIIRLECNDCGKSYEFNVGRGMADHSLERVLDNFDESTAYLIRTKLNKIDSEDSWSYRKMIGSCDLCGILTAVPVFVINGEGREYITGKKCECGKPFEIIDDEDKESMKKLTCPACKGRMGVKYTGMWD